MPPREYGVRRSTRRPSADLADRLYALREQPRSGIAPGRLHALPRSCRAAGPQGRRPPPRARAPPTVAWLEARRRWRTPACARRETPYARRQTPDARRQTPDANGTSVSAVRLQPLRIALGRSPRAVDARQQPNDGAKLLASATGSGCCLSSRRTGGAGVSTGRPLNDCRVGIGGGHVPAAALKRQCETAVAAARFKQPLAPLSSSACTTGGDSACGSRRGTPAPAGGGSARQSARTGCQVPAQAQAQRSRRHTRVHRPRQQVVTVLEHLGLTLISRTRMD